MGAASGTGGGARAGCGTRGTLAFVILDVFGTTFIMECRSAVLLAVGVILVGDDAVIIQFCANKLWNNNNSQPDSVHDIPRRRRPRGLLEGGWLAYPGHCLLVQVHIGVGTACTLTHEVESHLRASSIY